jgi:hypothetical protein
VRFKVEPDADGCERELDLTPVVDAGFIPADERWELVATPARPLIREVGKQPRAPSPGEVFVRRPGGKWVPLSTHLEGSGLMELSWRDRAANVQIEKRLLVLVPDDILDHDHPWPAALSAEPLHEPPEGPKRSGTRSSEPGLIARKTEVLAGKARPGEVGAAGQIGRLQRVDVADHKLRCTAEIGDIDAPLRGSMSLASNARICIAARNGMKCDEAMIELLQRLSDSKPSGDEDFWQLIRWADVRTNVAIMRAPAPPEEEDEIETAYRRAWRHVGSPVKLRSVVEQLEFYDDIFADGAPETAPKRKSIVDWVAKLRFVLETEFLKKKPV